MARDTVLLVEDEQHIVDVVEYVLVQDGFEVHAARDGDTGLALFGRLHPDLVILDLMLPGIPGLDLFRQMRRMRADAPIIMLTSRSEEVDRILGLELGADDYVTKPFSPRELAARVKCVLRRAARGAGAQAGATVVCGPLKLDPAAYAVLYFGRRVPMTRAEFAFVEHLIRYPAKVFTRDELIDRIYDGEHVVTDRSIDAYVKRLRRKFAEVRPDVDPIETVHGLGYKLNQALEDQ